jgi:hypothetical protein
MGKRSVRRLRLLDMFSEDSPRTSTRTSSSPSRARRVVVPLPRRTRRPPLEASWFPPVGSGVPLQDALHRLASWAATTDNFERPMSADDSEQARSVETPDLSGWRSAQLGIDSLAKIAVVFRLMSGSSRQCVHVLELPFGTGHFQLHRGEASLGGKLPTASVCARAGAHAQARKRAPRTSSRPSGLRPELPTSAASIEHSVKKSVQPSANRRGLTWLVWSD